MENDVIIALDFNSKKEVENFLNPFLTNNIKPFVKVGMELYYKEGESIIKYLKENDLKIFLDLKLFDIPTTVSKSLSVLKDLDVDIINVHALGGKEMLTQAKNVFKNTNTSLIAVTILTSTNDNTLKEMCIEKTMDDTILNLANLAKESGLDGVVCSAHEVKKIKTNISKNFITITPGIRLAGDNTNDQKRVMTPKEAKEIGTNFIVVGRSITNAGNPIQVYKRIKNDFEGRKNEL